MKVGARKLTSEEAKKIMLSLEDMFSKNPGTTNRQAQEFLDQVCPGHYSSIQCGMFADIRRKLGIEKEACVNGKVTVKSSDKKKVAKKKAKEAKPINLVDLGSAPAGVSNAVSLKVRELKKVMQDNGIDALKLDATTGEWAVKKSQWDAFSC